MHTGRGEQYKVTLPPRFYPKKLANKMQLNQKNVSSPNLPTWLKRHGPSPWVFNLCASLIQIVSSEFSKILMLVNNTCDNNWSSPFHHSQCKMWI